MSWVDTATALVASEIVAHYPSGGAGKGSMWLLTLVFKALAHEEDNLVLCVEGYCRHTCACAHTHKVMLAEDMHSPWEIGSLMVFGMFSHDVHQRMGERDCWKCASLEGPLRSQYPTKRVKSFKT